MFGVVKGPFRETFGNTEVVFKPTQNKAFYRRTNPDEEVKKWLFMKKGNIVIQPVEPLSVPKNVAKHLLIEFEEPIFIEPKVTGRFYLKFPIDIGVFASVNKKYRPFDVFTGGAPKYTLYGNPKTGVICRHHKTPVSLTKPTFEPMLEGIMSLKISNKDDECAEINKAVFCGYTMKMYYKGDLVTINATMDIVNQGLAQTGFVKQRIKGFNSGVELILASKLQRITPLYSMEEGF